MCLNEVPVGKYLSDAFPIKNGLKHAEVLWSFFFNFENMLSRGCSQTVGFKFVGTHRFWFTLVILLYWVKACIV